MFQSLLYKELSLDQVRYSLVWEDCSLLEKSWTVSPTDRILSIASSGCNCLNLALKNPQEIIAIDMNSFQLDLLQLKIQLISDLEYKDFIRVLNFEGKPAVDQSYINSLPLNEDSKRKLLAALPQLQEGLLSFGRLEQYFKIFRHQYLFKIWDEETRKNLKNAKTSEEQLKIIKGANFSQLEKAVEQFFSIQGLAKGRSEAQLKYVTVTNSGALFFQQFLQLIQKQLIGENFYLNFFIFGEAPKEPKYWLPYLQEKNFPALNQAVKKIKLVESDIETYLQKEQGFNFCNLSDIFEYMPTEHSEKLFNLLNQKLSKGGRIGYWTLLVDRQTKQMKKLETLSSDLAKQDRLFFYSSYNVYERT